MGHHGNSFLSFGAPVAAVGGWIELGRTTLGGTADIIDTASLADKRYFIVLSYCLNSGAIELAQRLGNSTIDTGNNYARRQSVNGATDATSVSRGNIDSSINPTSPHFMVSFIANRSTSEKLVQTWYIAQNTAGAGTAPQRSDTVGKWVETTNPIDIIQTQNVGGGDFAANSQQVVLGWDPADTHTTNFWEPLADVDLSAGEADVIDSGTITAKKYLWFQYFIEKSGVINPLIRFNSDSANNYASRQSINGATDNVEVNISHLDFPGHSINGNLFVNGFVVNNSANEKLVTGHTVDGNTAGAGTAPQRTEQAAKWANTAAQITDITITNAGAGNFGKDSFLKVWGSN